MKKEFYDIADYALERLKAGGADGGTVSVSRNKVDELNVDAGEFSLMRTIIDPKITALALIGSRKGIASVSAVDRESVDKAVAAAIDAAHVSEQDDGNIIAPGIGEHEFDSGPDTADLDAIYDRKREFMDGVAAEYPKIDLMQFITRFDASSALYANSNGTRIYHRAGSYSSSATFSAREGDNVTSMNGAGLASRDFAKPLLSYDFIRRALLEMEAQLRTVPVQGKFTGTILAAPDCAWSFIASALNSAVSNAVLIDGTSPWKDRLGTQVADPRLNIRFDPNDERLARANRSSGDGFLTEPLDLIKDGVLNSFLLNLYASRKTGLPRAVNYGSDPVVLPGDTPYADMVSGIESGLLVNRFSGGNPAQNGDFSGVAKNSFLIKNGKITDAVSETMISGNIFEMLNSVTAVSRELQEDGGSVLPWISFGGVTISGK